jgi:hypothetical protein
LILEQTKITEWHSSREKAMFNKFEWVFNALVVIGVLYTAYVVGFAIYLISMGDL